MAMQTPLARVLGLGSAKEGVSHWWWQRLTAIALIPLGLWFVFSVLTLVSSDHGSAIEWLRSPLKAAMFALFIVAALWHSLLGLQVVVEDYVHTEWLKMTVLIALKLLMVLLSVFSVFLILQISLGA